MAENAAASPGPVSGRIAIFGGSGFVGRGLQAALTGRPFRVVVRHPGTALDDTADIVAGDVTKPETLPMALKGCDAIINLVAIIAETDDATFDGVIRQGTVNLLLAAQRAGIRRFIQMSALGAQHDPQFAYFEAKWQAEQAVRQSSLDWTIFRPSIIFGPGDGFINQLADVVRAFPLIPVVGNGQSKFQPVARDDVATAFAHAVDHPDTIGQLYELGGPDVFTYEQLLDLIGKTLGKRKPKIHVPMPMMRVIVQLSQPLPAKLRPPVTLEQLKMLKVDNCTDRSATAELIGRPPRPLRGNIDYIRQ